MTLSDKTKKVKDPADSKMEGKITADFSSLVKHCGAIGNILQKFV